MRGPGDWNLPKEPAQHVHLPSPSPAGGNRADYVQSLGSAGKTNRHWALFCRLWLLNNILFAHLYPVLLGLEQKDTPLGGCGRDGR